MARPPFADPPLSAQTARGDQHTMLRDDPTLRITWAEAEITDKIVKTIDENDQSALTATIFTEMKKAQIPEIR